MRKIVNRAAAWTGAGISLVAVALIVAVYVQQWMSFFTPDITAMLTPLLLFGLPLSLVFIGFLGAALPKLEQRLGRPVVVLGVVAPLGAPLTVVLTPRVTPAPWVGWTILVIVTVVVIFAVVRKDLTGRLEAGYIRFAAVLVGLAEAMILAFGAFIPFPMGFFVLVPALTLGVPALLASRSQRRRPSLTPAAFIGIWGGVATLMMSAILGFMSIGLYAWVADMVLVSCALVVQFTGESADQY